MLHKLPPEFLIAMAREYQLSSDQQDVLLRRFVHHQEYEEISTELETSVGACLKRMGQVYKKFGFSSGRKGKEAELRKFLYKEYEEYQKLQESQSNLHDSSSDSHPNLDLGLPYPNGQVAVDSPLYIERYPIEEQCYQEIARHNALIRIKAPRQMGKTSLMSRILTHAAQQYHYQTIDINFQLCDQNFFESLDKLLKYFCATVGRKILEHPDNLNDYWDSDFLGSKMSCTSYFEECLLPQVDSCLVIGIDEVDRVFSIKNTWDIAQEFFGLLRGWHEAGKRGGVWQKLKLVLSYSTEIYIPLQANQSPFNVGFPVELSEFNFEQVKDLVARHQLDWQNEDIEQLVNLVGGHPFLVRLALYHIARGEVALQQLLANGATETGIYAEHLRCLLVDLEEHQLINAMKKVIAPQDSTAMTVEECFQLQSKGLTKFEGEQVKARCQLYHQYFTKQLA